MCFALWCVFLFTFAGPTLPKPGGTKDDILQSKQSSIVAGHLYIIRFQVVFRGVHIIAPLGSNTYNIICSSAAVEGFMKSIEKW